MRITADALDIGQFGVEFAKKPQRSQSGLVPATT
jgi:hypothetical protein